MRIALYQPEIAGNLGTILRTCACLNVEVDIIEPCGFPFSDRSLKRAGMDYFEHVRYTRHADWDAFRASCDSRKARIILLSSKADQPHFGFAYRTVHDQCDGRITIPMSPGMRSLNLAVSAGMALGEALRQTGQFPE